MKVSWVNGLDIDAAKEMRGDFLSSHLVRKRFKTLLMDNIESAQKTARNPEGYEVANWAYKQADINGYIRALYYAISLIED